MVRNGFVPKRGSSATSRFLSRTAGSGSTRTESAARRTGRPSACAAERAISDWTRGASTTYGTATAAARASTNRAATAAAIHLSIGAQETG